MIWKERSNCWSMSLNRWKGMRAIITKGNFQSLCGFLFYLKLHSRNFLNLKIDLSILVSKFWQL